jgi:hypothetical protein
MTNVKILTLLDFDVEVDQEAWRSIEDVLMGGVSASEFNVASDGLAVFEGVLSLERGEGFSFDRFRPIFRGRDVPDAPSLGFDPMISFGWMIASRQAGPFCLVIDWDRAYTDGAG